MKFKKDDFEIEVRGLEALMASFDKLPEEMQTKFVDKTMMDAGELVAKQARLNCPVDTGKLRNSIKAKKFKRQLINDVSVGTNVKYAKYVEFGSGRKASDNAVEFEELRSADWTNKEWKGGVRTTKTGKKIRWIAANPFMRKALASTKDRIVQMMEAGLEKFIADANAAIPGEIP